MVEGGKALPESVGDLFDTAFAAFGRRAGLYLTIAFIGFVIQGFVAALCAATHASTIVMSDASLIAGVIIDAFIMGVVTFGTIADVAGSTDVTSRTLLATTLVRWPLLTAVFSLATLITAITQDALFGGDGILTFLLFVLPVALIWGALSFPVVAAAMDATNPAVLRIYRGFAQGFRISLAQPNAGRTILLGLAALTPLLLQSVLLDQMTIHHVPGAVFWANAPVDAVCIGPFQAVFAVFYLDFVRRYNAAQVNR